MMKILHVITGLNVGGAEKMLVKFLTSQKEKASSLCVVSLKPKGTLHADIHSLGIPVLDLNIRGPLSFVFGFIKLRKIIRTFSPSVVHSWMYHANAIAALALLGNSTPLIWGIRFSIGNISQVKIPSRIVIFLTRLISFKPKTILYNATSVAMEHERMGYAVSKRVVLPNALDTSEWSRKAGETWDIRVHLGLPKETPLVGMVARYDPQKDFPNFLAAAAMVYAQDPRVHFVLLGPGVQLSQSALVQQINELRLTNNVHLLGEKSDVRPFLKNLDVFTLSSKYGESFPNAVLEAMAMKVPVVATDVGDCQRILADVGRVVPPSNPHLLAEAWSEILHLNETERTKLVEDAHQKVCRFYSLEKVAKEMNELYEHVVC